MFGDPSEDNNTDQGHEEPADDPLTEENPLFNDPTDPGEALGRLPWDELDDDTADELKNEVDDRLCDHDEHREVVSNQEGAGASIAGSGVQATTSVNKIVCTKCGKEWDTRDGSQQTGSDPFGI